MFDPNISNMLEMYNVDSLFEMLKQTNLLPNSYKKPSKASMIEMMVESYFTRERVVTSLDRLNKDERSVLDRMLHIEGEITAQGLQKQLIRAKLVEDAPVNPKVQNASYVGSPNRVGSKVFRDLMARLTFHGLVFSKVADTTNYTYKFNFDPGEILFIPDFVRRHLPAPPPLTDAIAEFSSAHIKQGDAQLLLRNLYLYWDFMRRAPVELLQNGMVGKRSFKLLNGVLLTPDPALENASKEEEMPKLYFLRLMLQGLKLLKVENNKLVVASNAQGGSDFWTLSSNEQATALVKAWLSLPAAIEISEESRRYAPSVQTARNKFIQLLAQRRPAWQEVPDFIELLQAKDRNYLFPRRTMAESSRGNYAFYEYGYYGDVKSLLLKLDKAEIEFIRFVLQQILFPLGLVELASETPGSDDWSAIRLTANGAAVLRAVQASSDTSMAETTVAYQVASERAVGSEGRVVIQPNFQALAMGPVPIATLAFLDRFAERRKADITVFEYYLTRQSVYDGLQRGLTVNEIETFLRQTSGSDVPQNVLRSLQEWGTHHDRIIFRSGVTLLQAATPALLNRLLEDAKTGKFLERSLTAEMALLNRGQLANLQSALINNALLPAISDDKPVAADHSIFINPKGEIRPIHSVPNLHLTGRLAKVAEPSKQGWRLTPASVRKSAGNRKKVEELLAELNKLHRGELPPALVAEIKKWGLYYGSATIDTLTLIEFSDRTTLNEVLQHPQLKDKLALYKAGERAVVTVESKQVKLVRQILTELGIENKVGGE